MKYFVYSDNLDAREGDVIKWNSGTLYLVCVDRNKQTLIRLYDLHVARDFNSDNEGDRLLFTKSATFVCKLPNIGEIIKNVRI